MEIFQDKCIGLPRAAAQCESLEARRLMSAASGIVATGLTVTPVERTLAPMELAAFSVADTTAPASDFLAIIDWKDGSGPLRVEPAGGAGQFTVTATHLYNGDGTLFPTVTIVDHSTGARAVATATAQIQEGDVLSDPVGVPLTGRAGQTVGADVLATFADSLGNNSADFLATINWGDGAASAGNVSGPAANVISVAGRHIYAAAGQYNASVTIQDDGEGTAHATATFSVAIAMSAESVKARGLKAKGVESAPMNAALATFTDGASVLEPDLYTAQIDWGDGATSAGTISAAAGKYVVLGAHVYAEQGDFAISVAIDDSAGHAAAAAASVRVIDAPLLPGTAGFSASRGEDFTGMVGGFFDSDTLNADPSDYRIVISWGDHTNSRATGVFLISPGEWGVFGTHNYAHKGSFRVSILIIDGGFTTSRGQAVVG